jgi:type I restriction enzyme S subunit
MSEWRKTTLGEFVSLQRGHDLTDPERKAGSVPVMGSAGQNGFHDTALAKGPGVVIGRSGASFGQVHFSPLDYWPHNTSLYVTDFHGNDPRFAYYFLNSIDFGGYNSGSAQPSLNRNFIYPIEIAVPGIEEQRAIAHILGTLDDKIELNRRMTETLEAMARAIFKSWFFDFDPVRAKADGEPPESICRRLGLTPDLLALFPDRFQDSELGEIPEGWPSTRLDGILELAYGKALKADERVEGPIPVYGSGGLTGYHDKPLIVGPTIVVGRKGTVGSLYWEDRPLYPIDTAFYVKPKVQLSFCYYLLQTLGLETMNTDAAVPGLNRNNVYRLLISLAPDPLRHAFDVFAKGLRDRIFANTQESMSIANLRDSLLPRLLSGKLLISPAGDE